MINRILKSTGWRIASLGVLLLLVFLAIWLAYRIPIGDPIASSGLVHYQLIDLGQGESIFRTEVERLAGNRRIFLSSGPAKFIYANASEAKAAWPESPFEMEKKGYTVQLKFTIQKLRFAPGYAPVSNLEIRNVPGTPEISK